jgi:hypothetical protein
VSTEAKGAAIMSGRFTQAAKMMTTEEPRVILAEFESYMELMLGFIEANLDRSILK